MDKKFFTSKRFKAYAGLVILSSCTLTSLYEIDFDHTKEECAITKVLNLIPVREDGISIGLALHQDHAIKRDLKELGYENIFIGYEVGIETESINIRADGEFINNIKVRRRIKNEKR